MRAAAFRHRPSLAPDVAERLGLLGAARLVELVWGRVGFDYEEQTTLDNTFIRVQALPSLRASRGAQRSAEPLPETNTSQPKRDEQQTGPLLVCKSETCETLERLQERKCSAVVGAAGRPPGQDGEARPRLGGEVAAPRLRGSAAPRLRGSAAPRRRGAEQSKAIRRRSAPRRRGRAAEAAEAAEAAGAAGAAGLGAARLRAARLGAARLGAARGSARLLGLAQAGLATEAARLRRAGRHRQGGLAWRPALPAVQGGAAS